MKKIFITILFNLIFEGYSMQKNSQSFTKSIEEKKIEIVKKGADNNQKKLNISIPDEIFVHNSNDKSENEMKDWSKNMPWIGAIIIGFLTVGGNVYISTQSRKSNSTVALQQMENAKVIAFQQMEQLRINNERDFNKTVLSGNRQLWISDFRTVISELLSLIAVFSQKQIMKDEDIHQLHLFVTKAEFMLTDDQSYTELKNKLGELKINCLEVMMQNKSFEDLELIVSVIKSNTLIVLKEEYEKARKGI